MWWTGNSPDLSGGRVPEWHSNNMHYHCVWISHCMVPIAQWIHPLSYVEHFSCATDELTSLLFMENRDRHRQHQWNQVYITGLHLIDIIITSTDVMMFFQTGKWSIMPMTRKHIRTFQMAISLWIEDSSSSSIQVYTQSCQFSFYHNIFLSLYVNRERL